MTSKKAKTVHYPTKPFPFTVTDDDAKHGIPKDRFRCSAALAIRRDPSVISVQVGMSRTSVEYKDRIDMYETPGAIRTELVALDRGGTFQPDDYSLRPLRPSARPTGRRTGGADTGRGARDRGSKNRIPRKPRIPAHYLDDVRPRYR